MRLAFFPVHVSKLPRLPRKSDARSYEVLHLSRKIVSANLKIWCSKMQPLSGNQRPDLLTALMNMSLVLRLPRKMHLSRSSSNVPRLPSFLEILQNLHVFSSLLTRCTVPCACHAKRHFKVQKWSGHLMLLTFWLKMCFAPQGRAFFRHLNFHKWSEAGVLCTFSLWNVLRAKTSFTFSTSQLPKVVRTWSVFSFFTWKCASRHNGVHFFDIATSKSGPSLRCFVHFDFEMCFAPQRRALFLHLNFQKWSENGVFCTFWLGNVLRATTACNFSSLTPAALASLLFDPPEPFRDFPTFSRICIFFLLTLSLLWSSLFYSSLLSDSSHLCFSSVHIVGSLTSKLPSIIWFYDYVYVYYINFGNVFFPLIHPQVIYLDVFLIKSPLVSASSSAASSGFNVAFQNGQSDSRRTSRGSKWIVLPKTKAGPSILWLLGVNTKYSQKVPTFCWWTYMNIIFFVAPLLPRSSKLRSDVFYWTSNIDHVFFSWYILQGAS